MDKSLGESLEDLKKIQDDMHEMQSKNVHLFKE